MFFMFLVALAFLRNFLFNAMGVNHFLLFQRAPVPLVQERVPVSRAELENGFHPQRVKVHPHPMLNVGGALQVGGFIYAPYSHPPGRTIETKTRVQHACTHDTL